MYHILLYPEASKGKQDFCFICAKTDFQLKVGSIKNRYFCTPRYWFVPPVSLRNKLVGTKKSVFCVEKFLIRTPKKIVFLCWLATYQTRFYLQSLETSPPTRIQARQAVQRSCRSRRLQASEAETSQARYVLITSYLTAFKTPIISY